MANISNIRRDLDGYEVEVHSVCENEEQFHDTDHSMHFGHVLHSVKLWPSTYCVKGTIDSEQVINPLLRT